MKWVKNYRGWNLVEWICEHGIGHYAKDIHGCDGCCSREDFPGRNKR